MARTLADPWRERRAAFRRFEHGSPAESSRAQATRLRWLDDALLFARQCGGLRARPVDSPESRAHRRRIRDARARIRG